MNNKVHKIVVLGGSFNPPTIAHKILLENAVSKIDASLGVFVPSSNNYVTRKMRKQGKETQVLSEDVRLQMLDAMCSTNRKLTTNTCEYGDDGRGHTYDTLMRIKNDYPNTDIYFIVGYDTIRMIPRWHSKEDLVRKFKFVVYSRDGLDAQAELNRYPLLVKYIEHFVCLDTPESTNGISSTLVRETLQKTDADLSHLIDDRALQILMDNKHYIM